MFQVHTLKGEAIQVYRMWQRILPVEDPGGTQNPSHGGVASQMSGLQPKLQSAVEPQNSFAHPYRPQALRMQLLRESIQKKLRFEETCVDSRSW